LSNLPQVSYSTADHLGSPRIITDGNGKVISRHDYLAFGDEVTDTVGNVGGRNSTQGYGVEDDIRKQYTGYEKDEESALDFAQARYYNGKHGRFTSVDPLVASANVKDPQTFNRYSYAMNSPYKFTDPLGLVANDVGGGSSRGGDVSHSFMTNSKSVGSLDFANGTEWYDSWSITYPPNTDQNATPIASANHEAEHDTTLGGQANISINRVEVFDEKPGEKKVGDAPFARPGAKPVSSNEVGSKFEEKEKKGNSSSTITIKDPSNQNSVFDVTRDVFYVQVEASMNGEAEFVKDRDDFLNIGSTGAEADTHSNKAMWSIVSQKIETKDDGVTAIVTVGVKLQNIGGFNSPINVTFEGKSTQSAAKGALWEKVTDPRASIKITIQPPKLIP
jgi:RHS repeat-associated protein